jgi:hypothetical protein
MAAEVGYWEESTGRRGSQGERGKREEGGVMAPSGVSRR